MILLISGSKSPTWKTLTPSKLFSWKNIDSQKTHFMKMHVDSVVLHLYSITNISMNKQKQHPFDRWPLYIVINWLYYNIKFGFTEIQTELIQFELVKLSVQL